MKQNGDGNIVQRRPAESVTGVAGALAFLVTYLLGVEDPTVYLCLGIVFSAVPSAVTWVVTLVRS